MSEIDRLDSVSRDCGRRYAEHVLAGRMVPVAPSHRRTLSAEFMRGYESMFFRPQDVDAAFERGRSFALAGGSLADGERRYSTQAFLDGYDKAKADAARMGERDQVAKALGFASGFTLSELRAMPAHEYKAIATGSGGFLPADIHPVLNWFWRRPEPGRAGGESSGHVEAPPSRPLTCDPVIDGRSLSELLEVDRDANRGDRSSALKRWELTPAQREAVSAHWSAQLRAKVAASEAEREAERRYVPWCPYGSEDE